MKTLKRLTIARILFWILYWILVPASIVLAFSCSTEDDTIQVDECSEIMIYYSELIMEEAISNGYEPGAGIDINVDSPLEDDFLDIYADPNLMILFKASGMFKHDYNKALDEANCR